MTTKEQLHQLIDQLPESDLPGVERLLADPLLRMLLTTPEGEEPLSAAEIAGILEAKRELATGQGRSFQSVEDAIRWLHEGPEPKRR